jgi:hypothetical protein
MQLNYTNYLYKKNKKQKKTSKLNYWPLLETILKTTLINSSIFFDTHIPLTLPVWHVREQFSLDLP